MCCTHIIPFCVFCDLHLPRTVREKSIRSCTLECRNTKISKLKWMCFLLHGTNFFRGEAKKLIFFTLPFLAVFFPCRSPCCEFSRSSREFSATRRSDDDMNFFLLFFQLFTFSKSPHFLLSHFSQHSTSEEEEEKKNFEWMKKKTRKENWVSSEKMNFFLPQFSLLFFSHAAHNTIWAYQRFIFAHPSSALRGMRRLTPAISLQRKLRLNKGNNKNFGR